jgi:hypothetical protein
VAVSEFPTRLSFDYGPGPKSPPIVVLSYAFIDPSGSAADFRGHGRFPNRYSMMRLDKR